MFEDLEGANYLVCARVVSQVIAQVLPAHEREIGAKIGVETD